jgi:hypothetical protein
MCKSDPKRKRKDWFQMMSKDKSRNTPVEYIYHKTSKAETWGLYACRLSRVLVKVLLPPPIHHSSTKQKWSTNHQIL